MRTSAIAGVIVLLLILAACPAAAADLRNGATEYTKIINAEEDLSVTWKNLADDYDYATRGLLAEVKPVIIRNADGQDVVNNTPYLELLKSEEAPDTVHNALYQQAKLNSISGLFQVTDSIYQVRGFDIAVMSFIKGDSGWIIIDPLSSMETASAAYDLITETVGEYPVKAVIYTHSHVDHYQGVKGVASEEDVASGKIEIIAPDGFMEHAVSENLYAGTAMNRRAIYMYGTWLPVDEKGKVDSGLGTTLSNSAGTTSLIAPTIDIKETGTVLTIDGVTMEFQITPGTEAPAEMNIWFPEEKAICMAENCAGTFHNILTIRGAQVRDPLSWSNYLDETLKLYGGEAEVMFTSHHWPRFGADTVIETLETQRDMYKYVHDQALFLINKGYTMDEISHMITLPDSLAQYGYTHEFYGTVHMAVRAIYQKYLGFYDANPTHLQTSSPEEFAEVIVKYMGGADAALAKLRADYAAGNYQDVATIAGYLVFADSKNYEARYLQANALEQLGYQSVSATERNAYLTGAYDLRASPEEEAARAALLSTHSPLGSEDVLDALSFGQIGQLFAIQLNTEKAAGKELSVAVCMNSEKGLWYGTVSLQNSVLHVSESLFGEDIDVLLYGDKDDFLAWVAEGDYSLDELEKTAEVYGDRDAAEALFGMLEAPSLNFNIVLP